MKNDLLNDSRVPCDGTSIRMVKKKSSNFLIIQNFATVTKTSVATNHFKLQFVMGYIKNRGGNSC